MAMTSHERLRMVKKEFKIHTGFRIAFVNLISLSDIRVTFIKLLGKCWEVFSGGAKQINLIDAQCLETLKHYRS